MTALAVLAEERREEVNLTVAGPWTEGTPCAETDLALFFPEHGNDAAAAAARSICRRCPSRMPCLEFALAHHEQGIWGASSDKDRERYRRHLRAGKPLDVIVSAEDAAHRARSAKSAQLRIAAGARKRNRERELRALRSAA